MKTIKKRIALILLTTLLVVPNLKAADIVGTTIEVTEDVINSFINEQYNKVGFLKNISGSVSGVTYDITLDLPNIRLLNNQARIVFGFRIASNVLNDYIEFEDGFSFLVPSINELSVKGVSQAFTASVNSLNLNSILKSVIIAAWNGLQLEVYPMNLAKRVENSEWLVERAIFVVDPYFSVSFNVVPGKLKIGLNTYLEGREYLNAGLFLENNRWWIKVSASFQVEVKEIYLYTLSGKLIAHVTDAGTCPKRGSLSILTNLNLYYDLFPMRILYETSNTFYVRGYKILPGGYVGPSNILN